MAFLFENSTYLCVSVKRISRNELIMNMALALIETWKYSWSRTFFGLLRHNINHVHVRVKKDHAPITQLRDFLNAAAFSSLTVSLILPLVHLFSGHVLTMRPDSELQRRVVLGVDDSENSERAFDCKYVTIIKRKKYIFIVFHFKESFLKISFPFGLGRTQHVCTLE